MEVRVEKIEQLTQIWWQRWINVAFWLLGGRGKWTTKHRNLEEGDIVLLKGEKKLGPDSFRLGKVVEVMPDSEGQVRTVMVGFRVKRRREADIKCSTTLESVKTAVQKLVVILPASEAWKGDLTQ